MEVSGDVLKLTVAEGYRAMSGAYASGQSDFGRMIELKIERVWEAAGISEADNIDPSSPEGQLLWQAFVDPSNGHVIEFGFASKTIVERIAECLQLGEEERQRRDNSEATLREQQRQQRRERIQRSRNQSRGRFSSLRIIQPYE